LLEGLSEVSRQAQVEQTFRGSFASHLYYEAGVELGYVGFFEAGAGVTGTGQALPVEVLPPEVGEFAEAQAGVAGGGDHPEELGGTGRVHEPCDLLGGHE
ncbi:MAG: hypothetical protein HY722_15905, partial [Planctomycetes bacterium]|nr:hypothetical protein [Planctomycetota bacterium]